VQNKAELEAGLKKIVALLRENVVCWVYYPKGTSKIQTDLTRDKGWETLLQYKSLQWLSLVSFNETWSAFAFRLKTDADKKKETAPKQRPIFQYIDAAKKEIRLPDDFASALKKAGKESAFFETLSFTNKKEYVEWIVSAKREETRAARVKDSVGRLAKGWKNPANR
jgi:hypothetical protein